MTSAPHSPVAGDPARRKRHALELFARLPSHYDRLGALLSFGQDPRWRRLLVSTVAASPSDRVLDVATGTGLVATSLVRRYGCSVVGLDQSSEMLSAARARLARDHQLGGAITLVAGEAEQLPFGNREFDHLTFTYLLRYVDDPQATMRELARVVAPGGRIASLEFGVPEAPWRLPWAAYTRFGLPALGRLVSRPWFDVGRFLASSIPAFYAAHPLEQLVGYWESAGIGEVRVRHMSLGAGVVMWGVRQDGDGAA